MSEEKTSRGERSAPRIVVVGSTNTDMIVRVEHLPAPGETVLGGHFMTAAGGKGANQAVAVARLGASVAFVACCGDDNLGRTTLQSLRKDGVDTSGIRLVEDAASGVALIVVDKIGQNSIAVASGANGQLSPRDVDRCESKIRNAAFVLIQLEIPLETVVATAKLAFRSGSKVILNPAPARELPEELYSTIAVLTPNEAEAHQLSGVAVHDVASAAQAARVLRGLGVDQIVITLGKEGAYLLSDDDEAHIPGYPVDAVDATAAGDVFNGALAVALAEGKALKEAVTFACAASALSVTKAGAQPSAPTRADVEQFLEDA